ncbi:alpha/beta hydrolase [Acidobacteria bacterium AB60]|nr:alpha/beta hydrolase [Acidobacteria bacterium AB60]
MVYLGLVLAACVGMALTVLLRRSARQRATRAEMGIRSPRGVVEEGFARIGGIDQWIGIRGEDRENPVLLVLHGGPGSSYTMFAPHMRRWEEHFTIVQWDQRGGGRTYRRNRAAGCRPLSLEQLARDAEEVAEYARKRLGKERIVLLASSLGTTFGMRVARRRPELFYAYVGVDQNTGMRRRREQGHAAVVERLRAQRAMRGVREMERKGADPTRWSARDYEAVARWTMRSDAAGFRRAMKLLKDAVWHAPGWSLRDIRAFVQGMHFSTEELLGEMVRFDAWTEGVRFEIPFFVFQGACDVLTTPALARAYFEDVVAPEKHFALIADAGHFAAFLQPDEFLRLLLSHVRPLALERAGGAGATGETGGETSITGERVSARVE